MEFGTLFGKIEQFFVYLQNIWNNVAIGHLSDIIVIVNS